MVKLNPTSFILAWMALITASCSDPGPDPDRGAGADHTPIVIYLVDTLRADRMGLYGYAERQTSPNLSAIAAESVVFENAYAPAPWTLPSIASIITSTYPCEHRMIDGRNELNASIKTLAELLSETDYVTGAYYSNPWAGPLLALDRGYAVSQWVGDDALAVDDLAINIPHVPWPRYTRAFLDRAGDRPFFLYIHTLEPHNPSVTPTEVIARFGHIGVTTRQSFRRNKNDFSRAVWGDLFGGHPIGTAGDAGKANSALQNMLAMRDSSSQLYDAAVRYADRNVADVIEVLKARGVWDRSIFVFLSDHGEEMADHGSWYHGQSVYEELMRVPLLMHFPGGKYGGKRIATPVSLVDVMPTLLDFAGRSELCAGCRGTSMRQLLDGPVTASDALRPVYGLRMNETAYFRPWLEARGNVNVMAREGPWKTIWNVELETAELYDLDNDHEEQIEMSRKNPQQMQKSLAGARDWLAGCLALEGQPGDARQYDVEHRARLRGLGYLE
jgi:arylsulfatase A-like enzyme